MKITVIGIGNVGSALARNLSKFGHEVIIAIHNPDSEKVKSALASIPNSSGMEMKEAIEAGDIILLATPFSAVDEIFNHLSLAKGKVLIDCTNPVAAGMTHGLDNKLGGSEYIQNKLPNIKVVKAFSIYGFENFIDTSYPNYCELKPAMLIAGNDSAAKEIVSVLIEDLGWEPVDTGGIDMSLHLEHMTLLWIKMARLQNKGVDFVWGMMKR